MIVAGLDVDLSCGRVGSRGSWVDLTRTEFDFLLPVLQAAPGVVTIRDLMESVWGWAPRGSSSAQHAYASRVRGKLRSIGVADRWVCVRGVGYRFRPLAGEAWLQLDGGLQVVGVLGDVQSWGLDGCVGECVGCVCGVWGGDRATVLAVARAALVSAGLPVVAWELPTAPGWATLTWVSGEAGWVRLWSVVG